MPGGVLTLANAVTAVRLGLAVWLGWLLYQNEPSLAAAVLALALTTDALDGWLARSRGETTKFGYLFDKIVDRLLLVGGLIVAIATQAVSPYAVWLVAKDFLALPAVTIKWQEGRSNFGMGMPGKVMTWLQGIGFLWLLLDLPASMAIAAGVGVAGAIVSGRYLYRLVYGKRL